MSRPAAISNHEIRAVINGRRRRDHWPVSVTVASAAADTPGDWVAQIAARAQALPAGSDGWYVVCYRRQDADWQLVPRPYRTRPAAQGRATRLSQGGRERAYVVSVFADEVIVWASRDTILGDFPRRRSG